MFDETLGSLSLTVAVPLSLRAGRVRIGLGNYFDGGPEREGGDDPAKVRLTLGWERWAFLPA